MWHQGNVSTLCRICGPSLSQSPRLVFETGYTSNAAMKHLASGIARHDFLVLVDVSSNAEESFRQKLVKVAGMRSEVKKQR